MSVGGEDRLCVVLTNPLPVYDDDGTEIGWKVATYDVGKHIMTEHHDCRRARDDDDLFHLRPQHSNPSFAATIAAFGEAMLDYADVAVNAELAAAFANHNEAMQRKQQEYEALRDDASAQIIGTHQYYRRLLKQIRAVLEVPPFVLNADAQCAAIRRILAHEESGE
jgi:hypothetical protein